MESCPVLDIFEENFIGTISVPLRRLLPHPKQRQIRPDHVQALSETMDQYEQRRIHCIYVVLPAVDATAPDATRVWVTEAEKGTLSTPIPEGLFLQVIDGYHRVCASIKHLESLSGTDQQMDPRAEFWPARVYKHSEPFHFPSTRI